MSVVRGLAVARPVDSNRVNDSSPERHMRAIALGLVLVTGGPARADDVLFEDAFKDGTLTFSAVRKFMDNEFPLDFKLTIDGDKFKGKAAADIMGEKREFDIEGKRQKE